MTTTPPVAPASKRPLSPHLQVWKWTVPMALSILHRATGIALSVGTLMLVWWLAAAASGPGAYSNFSDFVATDLGQFMMLGWTFSLYLHLFAGLRHLVMDAGAWLTIKGARTASAFVILAAILATAATWAYVRG